MKITACLLLLFVFAFCKQEKPILAPEKPQEKKVVYEIFAARNYTGTQVENVKAELRLQMRIINYQTGAQSLVWDSILPVRRIADFPLYDNRFIVEKMYPVLNSHQKLNGSYSIIYRDGETISQAGSSDEAGPGTDAITLQADL
ncbi:MAG TPA: hypothetical protein VGN63_17740 [Flavisolibacter sp.]|nr:hypothetical protein [Flavisolibacter sp.]